MRENQVQELLFIEQLNSYRMDLRDNIESNKQINSLMLADSLMKIQLLMYQNKNDIDLQEEFKQNTSNLLKIIEWENAVEDEQTFTVNFQDDLKQLVSNQFFENSNVHFHEHDHNHDQKFQRQRPQKIERPQRNQRQKIVGFEAPKLTWREAKQLQGKNFLDAKIQQEKRKPAQFVSANSLPKGTSVRKKFVPPFKKQKQQPLKAKQGSKQDDVMDSKYGNLQAKLVQIIQSEIVQRNKKVEWSEIAGLGFAKKVIHEMIVWPMLRPDIFTGLRAPPKGVLLFGPPGTGKTMIGRAIASEASATFFSISASSITSKWVGESQKLVKTLFAIARNRQPSVIFIDEIDSLLCARKQGEQQSTRRVKTQFLVQLDGAKGSGSQDKILVIGATNLPSQLDDAARRRFVKRLYIPLPNNQGRKQLLTSLTNNSSFQLSAEDIQKISNLTINFSGADIYNLCQQSSFMPLRALSSIETIRTSEVPVTKYQHFEDAIKMVRPSVNSEALEGYQRWNQQYGSYQLSSEDLQKC